MRKFGLGDVRDWYRRQRPVKRSKLDPFDPSQWTLTNVPQGIGDCVILTDHFRACSQNGMPASVYSSAPAWSTVRGFCPWAVSIEHPQQLALCHAVRQFDLGPGHMIDRSRRLFGLEPEPVPRGALDVPGVRRIRNRVSLHFEPGAHAVWQERNIHPRARQLYPQSRAALREFITEHGSEFSWIEFGTRGVMNHELVEDATGRPLADTIRLMSECEYHVGVVSGPMHLAAALGLKVITLLNFPHPSQLMLPNLVDIGVVEQEWLYPQAVHLHQEADSRHWPRFTKSNLARAFDGAIYPYWK